MKKITKNDLKELATVHGLNCLSLFIPTHTKGDKDFRTADALLLKNELKELKRKLLTRGMTEAEISDLVSPIEQLVVDTEFWSHQSGGLALFISDNVFRKFELPLQFEPGHYVSTGFYILPLFAAIAPLDEFFLLTLETDEVRLYKGSFEDLQKVDASEFTPSGIEEVIGTDYEQRSLQFKSQQPGNGYSVYYGHGTDDDNKTEIKKYLREVVKGIEKLLKDNKAPMVVAGPDELFSMYREVNTFSHLYERHISCKPKLMDLSFLHNKALDVLEPYYNKTRTDKTEAFRQLSGTPKTSNNIDEIVPAAIHGKIDTLFLLKNKDNFGLYDAQSDKVEYKEDAGMVEVSLFNLVAKEAFLHGANVYLVEREEMPDGFSIINALYRY